MVLNMRPHLVTPAIHSSSKLSDMRKHWSRTVVLCYGSISNNLFNNLIYVGKGENKMELKKIHFRACKAIVMLCRDQVDSGIKCMNSRIFNYILHPEHRYVHCGNSVAVLSGERAHPEHIVPCAFLLKQVIRLIEEGRHSDEQIAEMLQRHWKIVTITKEEAKRLDSELKLKSSMPADWCFETGDSFARLKKANIEFVLS